MVQITKGNGWCPGWRFKAGWCWDRGSRSGLGPMEKARTKFLKTGVQVQRRISYWVLTYWPLFPTQGALSLQAGSKQPLRKEGRDVGLGNQTVHHSGSQWALSSKKYPLSLIQDQWYLKFHHSVFISLNQIFFSLGIIVQNVGIARCGPHRVTHSSCIQTSVCWDACNSPRGFMWALTFSRPGAASSRGGEEAPLGLWGLGRKLGKDGSSHSICSLLPAHIGVLWDLVSRFSSPHEDYRHLVMGKMVWKGKGRNTVSTVSFFWGPNLWRDLLPLVSRLPLRTLIPLSFGHNLAEAAFNLGPKATWEMYECGKGGGGRGIN